jgi:RND superfamily putative drug exporter
VAFGIVLDTFVVRSVLVCALLLDIGGRAWWPNRVDPSANGAEATGTAAGDGPSGPAAGADDEDGERGQP